MADAQNYPSSIYTPSADKKRTPKEIEEMKRVVDLQRGKSLLLEMRGLTTESFRRGSPVESKTSMELMKKAKKYIVPSLEIQNNYSNFLKLPNTGIVKLLSQKSCSTISGSDNKEKFSEYLKRCAPDFIRGHGKYFSFRQNDYVDENLADIGFVDNWFFSLGTMNQGILVALGDTEIQGLSLNSKGIDFLAGFAPSLNMDDAAKEFKQFEEVLKDKGLSYGKVVSIEKDQTYALRVIAYNNYFVIEEKEKKPAPMKLFPLGKDKREDIIVAFRVVEKNEDGSLTLLWKELQRKQSPEIVISTIKRD